LGTNNQPALDLISRMETLLAQTTRVPYGYNSLGEWIVSYRKKIDEIIKKEKIR